MMIWIAKITWPENCVVTTTRMNMTIPSYTILTTTVMILPHCLSTLEENSIQGRIHKHGTACVSLLGGKTHLDAHNASGMEHMNNINLPKHIPHRCPRLDATCIEGLHPLDVIQHYEELIDLRLEPYLHVQENGDAFCFPEGWYHGTLNVDNDVTLAVSLVLDEQEVSIETNFEWGRGRFR